MTGRKWGLLLAACLCILLSSPCGKDVPLPKAGEYLSDTDPLYRDLEERQREVSGCDPRSSLAAEIERQERWLNMECRKPDQQWLCPESYLGLKTLRSLPRTTRCENGLGLAGPALYAEKLDRILASDVPRPRLGTLQTGDLNAFAIGFGNSDYLVIFNPRLTDVHREIMRYVFNLMDLTQSNDGTIVLSFSARVARKRIAEDPTQAEYFRSLIAAAVRSEPLPVAPDMQRVTPDRFEILARSVLHQRIVSSLVDEGEHFVVAHEYAHAGLRHGAESKADFISPGMSRPLSVATRGIEREYEADAAALTIWLVTLGRDGSVDREIIAMLPAAAEMFLTSARLMELEREISGLPQPPGIPLADVRREKIREVLKRLKLVVEGELDFGGNFHTAALIAWAHINRDRLKELHDRGVDIPLTRTE